jgi:hypothetical protein
MRGCCKLYDCKNMFPRSCKEKLVLYMMEKSLKTSGILLKIAKLLNNFHGKIQYLIIKKSHKKFVRLSIKSKSHEIFDLWFFHKSTTPRPLINTLKYL